MSLSIRQYAIIFAAISIMMIAGFAYRAYVQFGQTSNQIQHSHQLAAEKELAHNLVNALQTLATTSDKLISWEETHQQLANPAYFAYWYNSRMKQTASDLHLFISDLMLYDTNGNALAKLSDSTLPYKLENIASEPRFTAIDDNQLIFTMPVRDKSSGNTIGHLSLRTNLIRLLKNQTNYYYIEPESLSLSADILGKNATTIEPASINYDAASTPELERLEQQLRTSITELVILVILPALILYSLLVYIVSMPINGISEYLEKLRLSPDHKDEHHYDFFFKVKELKTVYESLRDYHLELFDTNAILDEKNRALWDQAHHDALTGAYNRRAFDDQWSNLNDLLAEHRVDISFILFDVNLFKSINDTHGHPVGDEVLKTIANCIKGSLRKGEHLFRLGGDEFASFLIDSTTETAIEVAQRCLDNISAFPFESIGMPEPVRVSIGISQASSDNLDSFNDLQWQADAAMYAAKRPGKSDIVVYRDDITEDSKGLLSSWLSNTVYQAIDKGTGLVLFYQPIIDFKHSQISYFEALVRIHANGELITPASIFNVVEARRFEVELDRAVIRKLIEDLGNRKIPAGTGVSLNLSAPTLTNKLIVEWLSPLNAYTGNYKIVLEVTETALITDIKRVTQHLNELRKTGFIIALDDFGSGYSSVKYLASMPVDVVKFDITLIHGLFDDSQRLMITRLAEMIEEAGHQLVAEGIEDKTLLDLVVSSGFHFGQGWLFGRPEELPRKQDEIKQLLLEHQPSFSKLAAK